MNLHPTPKLSRELLQRIKLVRRDIGNLLFHFTRTPEEGTIDDARIRVDASSILRKILVEGKLRGTSKWTYGENCVCFTEAPIQEFNSIFSLVEIASSKKERPRYEPYGIAVTKEFLFKEGGRPVIYDHPETFHEVPQNQKYRFVPYDPEQGIDFTWEREWRIKTDYLKLNPKFSLVVVPTSSEAFEIVYEFAEIQTEYDTYGEEAEVTGFYHEARWLAVSLDLFGLKI